LRGLRDFIEVTLFYRFIVIKQGDKGCRPEALGIEAVLKGGRRDGDSLLIRAESPVRPFRAGNALKNKKFYAFILSRREHTRQFPAKLPDTNN
jgi:hypothetical protein